MNYEMNNFELQNTVNKLEKEFHGTDYILGRGLLTSADKLNASRGVMFSNHLEQTVVLNKPSTPRVFSNYENLFGEYSSSKEVAKSYYKIIKKISKFNIENLEDTNYILLVYDEINKEYDIIEKRQHEKLVESYGFVYNTDVIDSKFEGDEIRKGEVLFKSTNFDEYNNYMYGTNALTVDMIEDYTIEDAIICSESFANRVNSTEIDEVTISLNDNDMLLNLYGDDNIYKAFPNIGEETWKQLVCVKRRINKNTMLYDLKKDVLREIDFDNDILSISNGRVMDIDIFCNKTFDEIPNTIYYNQLKKYYKEILNYNTEIVNNLAPIVKTKKYTKKLARIYQKSLNILDDRVKWRNDKSDFSNMMIKFTLYKNSPLKVGSKITGRYGDKGVISKIVPDDEMLHLSDGRVVDMICNKLGVVNRLNPGQLVEVETNFISNRIMEMINTKDKMKDKINLLIKYVSMMNKRQGTEMKGYIDKMSNSEREVFFETLNKTGISIHNPPMWANIKFDTIRKVYDEFDIQRYDVYLNRFGREIKLMNRLVVGEKYILKLKHSPMSKFIARSTGFIDMKGLPAKSLSKKMKEDLYSKNPIRLGEQENLNLTLSKNMNELMRMHMLYRNSITGRRATEQLLTDDITNIEKIKLPDGARNRTSEMLQTLLKSIGLHIDIEDDVINQNKEYLEQKGFKLGWKEEDVKGFKLELENTVKGFKLELENDVKCFKL